MKKSNIIGAFAGFYFGAALSGFAGIYLDDWRWWAIVMPVIALHVWEKNEFKNED